MKAGDIVRCGRKKQKYKLISPFATARGEEGWWAWPEGTMSQGINRRMYPLPTDKLKVVA